MRKAASGRAGRAADARRPHSSETLLLAAGRRAALCLLQAAALSGLALASATARQPASSTAPDPPLALATLASSEVTLAGGEAVVWRIQVDPAPEADVPLHVALAERPLPRMHGEHGAFRRTAAPVRDARLAAGTPVTLAGPGIDALAVGIGLAPAAILPAAPRGGTLISEPFSAPGPAAAGSAAPRLVAQRGVLAAGERAALPRVRWPALLLSADRPLRIETPQGSHTTLGRGEVTLLPPGEMLVVDNPGARPAAVVLVQLSMAPANGAVSSAAAGPGNGRPPVDRAIAGAWRDQGCQLNPGTPACLAVGLAAACQLEPLATGCDADSDGDGCRDTAEVRAALDPYDAADCLSSRDGQPPLNCLFPSVAAACDGSRAGEEPATGRAVVDRPGSARGAPAASEERECGPRERDPACDGFAPAAR